MVASRVLRYRGDSQFAGRSGAGCGVPVQSSEHLQSGRWSRCGSRMFGGHTINFGSGIFAQKVAANLPRLIRPTYRARSRKICACRLFRPSITQKSRVDHGAIRCGCFVGARAVPMPASGKSRREIARLLGVPVSTVMDACKTSTSHVKRRSAP